MPSKARQKDLSAWVCAVRPGDDLTSIVTRRYPSLPTNQREGQIKAILVDNPWITNSRRLTSGKLIFLDGQPNTRPASELQWLGYLNAVRERAEPRARSVVDALTPSALNIAAGGLTGAALGLDTVRHSFESNKATVRSIAESYNAYKNGNLTKGQYDFRRRKLIASLKAKLGPLDHSLFGSTPANKILRIDRGAKLPTRTLMEYVRKMDAVARYARHGGVALAGIDLGLACYQIGGEATQREKNETLVESLGALGGGMVYGFGVTLFVGISATPIGWVAALILAGGGIASGIVGSKVAVFGYRTFAPGVDVVGLTRIDRLCSR